MSIAENSGKLKELKVFLKDLKSYQKLLNSNTGLSPIQQGRKEGLRCKLLERRGPLGRTIVSLTGKGLLRTPQWGRTTNMWDDGLSTSNLRNSEALKFCIDATIEAIGTLKSDIDKGVRDEQGNLIDKESTKESLTPKAFIAHEGETRALNMLKEFLEALEIQYFIAESKASNGRSIEKQVDWTQELADFAIILATKGKAINRKTGKHYMGLNVADELGRARQVYGNHIILLVQKGVEVHTNIREIVHENFTTTNMEVAFIKIIKELKNWGYITIGKLQEYSLDHKTL
ncbi:MAG: hypothetical protein FJ015_00095 [Chloroflexi bacterium]|nr:hypothetical protein [Chloroflexota bacterium]